jgi:glucose/arabinose dehydrogenase
MSLLWLALLASPPALAVPPDLTLVTFASGGGLTNPLAVRHAGDGSGRVYVVQRNGIIRAYDASGTALGVVLSFAANPPPQGFSTGTGGDERGLLGLAFHPQYPNDPRMFVYYTDGNSDTVVASYTVGGSPPVANPASAAIVLRVDQDFTNHNGGDIHFGADEYLYIGLGDGGSGNDPCNRAQTLNPADLIVTGSCAPDANFLGDNPDSLALLGKMLRIDVDAITPAGANGLCGGNANGSANYAIPVGNPFASGSTANGCDEVWHYGLRNPYRFSFDRDTGDMFIGDVGQVNWEEISFAAVDVGGLNYGWKICEGFHQSGSNVVLCPLAGSTLPILAYARSGGNCAVTGGFRYRGPIAALRGEYVYADYCSGRIQIASESRNGWTTALWRTEPYSIAGFGEDEAGDLYLTDFFGGRVLRFHLPAMAADDAYTVDEDSDTTALDVLANDHGPQPLTVAALTQPANGVATNDGSTIGYRPNDDFCGSDGFGYTTSAGPSAAVVVTVLCIEDGDALAVDDAFSVLQDSVANVLDVLANDGEDPDPEQNPVAVVAVTTPAHGSVVNHGDHVRYTPVAGYCGGDGFAYTIDGGSQADVVLDVQCRPEQLFRDGFEAP